MDKIGMFVTMISSITAFIGFISIFVKLGKERGEFNVTMREIRKDVDTNAKDINSLGSKVNQMQIENTKMMTTLSSDLGWIKSSLMDIKSEMKGGKNGC